MAGSRNRTPPERTLDDAAAGVLAAAVAPGQRVCVAVSGGVDSTVLLHVLARLRARFGFDLVAAHVHHGLSPNADAWRDACGRECARLDVPFHAFRVDVARGDPAGLEAAARAARSAALREVRCDWLASAHHQNDQAETLLFRLLRGAGVRGAAAIVAIEPGMPGRLRPLLDVPRPDIVAFARAAALDWVEDESNADPRLARNFLRHRVFPSIEQAWPGAVASLARAAQNFREADELLDALAELDAERCGGERLARGPLLALPDARVRNLLRRRIRAAGCDAPARARLVEAVRQLREAGARPLRIALGALVCCAYRDDVWLEAADDGAPPGELAWAGEPEIPWAGGLLRFEPAVGSGVRRAALAGATVAPRWPGLSMRLDARRPPRTFKNLCQEAGVPAWLRPRLPVLRVGGEAAWIAEIGVADGFRCAPGDDGVLPVWRRAGGARP